jgi:hypothetical protein
MKKLTYPYFRATGEVEVLFYDSNLPCLTIKVAFYCSFLTEAHNIAQRETKYKLELLGVDQDVLKNASFEADNFTFEAKDAKFVKREWRSPIEAFRLCDPKKRDTLIRQRRLVPFDHAEMVDMYGKPPVLTPSTQEATA